jgi:regulator of replication initiation timing
MKEIFDKTHVVEEENTLLREEVLKLNQERAALIEEKVLIPLEKSELDSVVSKLNLKLAEIPVCIKEAEMLALAERSNVRVVQFEEIVFLF